MFVIWWPSAAGHTQETVPLVVEGTVQNFVEQACEERGVQIQNYCVCDVFGLIVSPTLSVGDVTSHCLVLYDRDDSMFLNDFHSSTEDSQQLASELCSASWTGDLGKVKEMISQGKYLRAINLPNDRGMEHLVALLV